MKEKVEAKIASSHRKRESKSMFVHTNPDSNRFTEQIFEGDMTRHDLALTDNQMKNFIKDGIQNQWINERPTRQQLYFLYKLIMNRVEINYSLRDYLRYLVAKLCICCNFLRRKSSIKTSLQRQKMFQKGC